MPQLSELFFKMGNKTSVFQMGKQAETFPQGHIAWKRWTWGFNPETWGVGGRFSKVVGLIKIALDY